MTSSDAVELLTGTLRRVDAVVVGAGSGLSTAAGLTYSGERFERLFPDFIAAYGLSDMYSAGFFPFPTPEERWAYWSRHVMANRYDQPSSAVYRTLRELVSEREHFVVTTNVDHAFLLNGFESDHLFAMQGDYGLFQCSAPCRQMTWSNEDQIRAMVAAQRHCRIPVELVPRCPNCGAEAMMHLRVDRRFVQDDDWHTAHKRYQRFLDEHRTARVLYLELGVGWNTPSLIKYPFWRLTYENRNAAFATLNTDASIPSEIADRSVAVVDDIAATLQAL